MAQLLPFSNLDLEKLYIYITFLNRLIPGQTSDRLKGLLERVDMQSYHIDDSDEGEEIDLDEGEGELKGMGTGSGPGVFNIKEKTRLSQIIETLNEAFATDFGDEDELFIGQMANHMMADENLINKVKENTKENVAAIFDKVFEKELVNIYESNFDFYNKISNNEELRERLKKDLLDYVYEEKGEKA